MGKRAVLLANLGSPDNTDVSSVRRYLNQFLMDPYVIQLPWILRRLIVGLFVLPFRPKNSAKAYQSVWTDRGSPLIALSMDLLESLQQKVAMPVGMSMRYGKPSIESELLRLANEPDVEEILFIPLYPHYAESTVTTSFKEAENVISKHNLDITLTVLSPFYNKPDYIQALVSSASEYLDNTESYDHILFSYHGLPELHLTKADPTNSHCLKTTDCCTMPSPAHATCYRHQVYETTRLFVENAGLNEDQYTVSFQSRLGKAKWLEPSTEETLKKLARNEVKKILVLCPAFVTDCLETLEEIEIQGAEQFKQAGGESLILVPCLNSHPAWVDTLSGWIQDPETTG
jgi:protoporphyrin/coproporphyrin ferrochelatase